MDQMIDKAGLGISAALAQFVDHDVLPGTGLTAEAYWAGAAAIFAKLAPENMALLATRDTLQANLDDWHRASPGAPNPAAYETHLRDIGYLVAEPGAFTIDPQNVDDEIARMAGPQLVVPVLNARFLLNAANARWGSLYDALYGTDAIPGGI